ncbi:hypothetical protein RHGRI_021546 [Rhododendron griersonianum]|uniref:Uncharacterized protein n=1 Tax=Rhododendron griersonianum TaxID=479676 RepID=A0AAV6JKX5_9ERIC|nr:hypothetical protein RHGRI_021546 [Rhododendron griersonianum]
MHRHVRSNVAMDNGQAFEVPLPEASRYQVYKARCRGQSHVLLSLLMLLSSLPNLESKLCLVSFCSDLALTSKDGINFRKGVAIDRLVGFQDLGGKDDFTTKTLEALLLRKGILSEVKRDEEDEDGDYHGNRRRAVKGYQHQNASPLGILGTSMESEDSAPVQLVNHQSGPVLNLFNRSPRSRAFFTLAPIKYLRQNRHHQMAVRAWESGLVLLLVFGRLTWAEAVRVPVAPLCAAKSVGESVLLRLGETSRCPRDGYESAQSVDSVRVTELKDYGLKKSSTSASAAIDDTLTAYEVLEEYDFPIGLLPQGITGYELEKSTGEFSAYLNSTCTFAISGYELKYKTTITGVITSGKLYKLSGISVKVLFLWLNIAEVIRDDDDDEEELEFSVGIASADFPVDGFNERPRCGCGFDCGDVSGGRTRSRGAIFNLYRVLSDLLD